MEILMKKLHVDESSKLVIEYFDKVYERSGDICDLIWKVIEVHEYLEKHTHVHAYLP